MRRQSNLGWHRYYTFLGLTVYELAVGTGVGFAIVGLIATFGIQIQLWPTYLLIGTCSALYLIANVVQTYQNNCLELKKNNALSHILTQEKIAHWHQIYETYKDANGQISGPIFGQQLQSYLFRTTTDLMTDDIALRLYDYLSEVRQLLKQDSTANLQLSNAQYQVKKQTKHLLQQIAWMKDRCKDPELRQKMHFMHSAELIAPQTKKIDSPLTNFLHLLASYNQSLFYSLCAGMYVYGQYYAGFSLHALWPAGTITIGATMLTAAFFGYLLDREPIDRRRELSDIRYAKQQLQTKHDLTEVALSLVHNITMLKYYQSQLQPAKSVQISLPNQSQAHNIHLLGKRQYPTQLNESAQLYFSKKLLSSPLQFTEIEKADRLKSYLALDSVNMTSEALLAIVSGIGVAAVLYPMFPSLLATYPWLSSALSLSTGTYYAWFRLHELSFKKVIEERRHAGLQKVVTVAKQAIWHEQLRNASVGLIQRNDKKMVPFNEYVKDRSLRDMLKDLRTHYQQFQAKIVSFEQREQSYTDANSSDLFLKMNDYLKRHQQSLNNQLLMQVSAIKKPTIQAKWSDYLMGISMRETTPLTYFEQYINDPFWWVVATIENNYKDFIDGAASGASVLAPSILGSSLMTMQASSAIILGATFFLSGTLWIILLRLVLDEKNRYRDTLKDLKNQLKTRRALVDSLMTIFTFQQHIDLALNRASLEHQTPSLTRHDQQKSSIHTGSQLSIEKPHRAEGAAIDLNEVTPHLEDRHTKTDSNALPSPLSSDLNEKSIHLLCQSLGGFFQQQQGGSTSEKCADIELTRWEINHAF